MASTELPQISFARLPRLSLYFFGSPHLNRQQIPGSIPGNLAYPDKASAHWFYLYSKSESPWVPGGPISLGIIRRLPTLLSQVSAFAGGSVSTLDRLEARDGPLSQKEIIPM